jgi:hypothetical protein
LNTANNYKDDFYFTLKLPDFDIKTSVDLINLSGIRTKFSMLDNAMKEHLKVQQDYPLSKGNFRRKRVYENHTGTVDLFHQPVTGIKYMPYQFLMYLHQPNTEMITLIDRIFKSLGISPLISKIELAWDFYTSTTPGAYVLKEYFERHLFLKYQKSPSWRFKDEEDKDEDTFYTNDLRKSVKGLRLYLKPEFSNHKDYVRLELELHRAKIKQMHIDFPLTPDQLDRDFRNHFEFRKWDAPKLYRYMINQNRRQIANANFRSPKSGQLGLRVIESWLRTVCNMPMMKAVEHLKSKAHCVPNYYRFFVPMDELNLLIEQSANEQRFQLQNI